MTSVLIVDDNPVIRMGLRSLLELEDGLVVAGEAGSGPEAVALARDLGPDVVLLDVRMPGGGGLEALADLVEVTKVLMLTYSDEAQVISQALRNGATGFLVHGAFDSAELAVAVRDTAAGRPRLSPAAASVLLHGVPAAAPGDGPAPAVAALGAALGGRGTLAPDDVHAAHVVEAGSRYGLSRRELEISHAIVRGHTNSEIAGQLFIEEKTVKNHINRLFAKLGAANRPEAISLLLGTRDR